MSSRYLWLLAFGLLVMGFGCGGIGLYLIVKQMDAGLYLLIASALPIVVGGIFAAIAFQYGLKDK